jgi:hypothetical protein
MLASRQGPPVNALAAPAETPAQKQIAADYKASAQKDVADPRTLKVINDELQKADPNAKPITQAEAKKKIADTDVRVLSGDDYKAVKSALKGSWTNPASAGNSDTRGQLADPEAAKRLATARARERTQLSNTQPTDAEVQQAAADLQRIDPGAFKKPPKDVIYVNEDQARKPISDPTKTKVADHEFTHILLQSRGMSGDDAGQHKIIGKLGWNQSLDQGDNSNWGTPPGQGLPQ